MFKSVIFICILVVAAAAEESDPILVDEFESFGCCDLRSRLDLFLSELANNPTNVGLVVTGGPADKFVGKVIREEMVRSHVRFRNFDPGRLRFVRIDGDKVLTRLFRMRAGTSMPALPAADNTYVLTIDVPTQVLTYYPSGDGGLCPEVQHRDMFAFFLVANPSSRARVVIRGYSPRGSKRIERELSRFFVRDQEIDRRRLQFAHLRRIDGEGWGPSIEYWYLP